MAVDLTATEARVLGCLMEKSVVTPDVYPMTLNALTNACNQKSSRHPVMSLDPGEVQQALHNLKAKHVVRIEENFRKQTEKYSQRFCNTPFSDYQLDEPQFATICVMLLRGPRTPGEIRANSGRLHTFEDNDAVLETLKSLINPEDGEPLVYELSRTPGRRKDPEYMHLLGDTHGVKAASQSRPPTPSPTVNAGSIATAATGSAPDRDLLDRVATLEREVAELKRLLGAAD